MSDVADRSPMHAGLGRAVRELRERQRLSQQELAERSGLHVTYLSGVEHGKRNPTWAVILDLASALEVPPSKLVKLAERLA
jgi:transcriptional regulator with XRE-family HTH domain